MNAALDPRMIAEANTAYLRQFARRLSATAALSVPPEVLEAAIADHVARRPFDDTPATPAEARDVVSREDYVELEGQARNSAELAGDLVELVDEVIRGEVPVIIGEVDADTALELTALATRATAVLDADRKRTGVDEWDESDRRCYLYNAAAAVLEGRDPTEA